LEDPSKNIPVIEYTSDESLAQIKTILSKIKNKDFNFATDLSLWCFEEL